MQVIQPHRRINHSLFNPTRSVNNVGYWNWRANSAGIVDNQFIQKGAAENANILYQQHNTIGGNAVGGTNKPTWVDERFGANKDAGYFAAAATNKIMTISHYAEILFAEDDPFTISFAFEFPVAQAATFNTIIDKGITGGGAGFRVLGHSGQMRFRLDDGTTPIEIRTTASFRDGTKHFCQCKKGAGLTETALDIYIDGSNQATTDIATGTLAANLGTSDMTFADTTFDIDGYLGGVIIDAEVTNAERDASLQALLI